MELIDRITEAFNKPAGLRHLLDIERQHQAQVLRVRRAQHEQLQGLEAELEAAAPRLRDRVIDREAAVAEARRALEAAEITCNVARASYIEGTTNLENQINRLRRTLVDSASPAIATFLAELARLEDDTRRPERLAVLESRHPITGNPTVNSNADSLTARMATIRAARNAAEALKLEPLEEAEIERRVAALRERIPAIESVEVPA